jgi:8-oxo-dGTP pyrophosphatase MutT (NUDIX family)
MAQGFSPIQNHILSKLKNADRLRYSELQPESIPNDLFNYHLQFLVKKEFVNRKDDGYSLAEKGIKHVADANVLEGQDKINSLFKFNVITIISRVVKGKIEILSQERTSHPSFGKIGVMGGIVRKGELVEAAAKRKLKVETGLDASPRLIGMERRLMYKEGQLFSDIIFPITYANNFSGQLEVETEFGHNFWLPIDKAIENESSDFDSLRKVVDVLKAIKKGTLEKLPFFYEEDIQSQV